MVIIPVVNGALTATVLGQDLGNGSNCYGCPNKHGTLAAGVFGDRQNHEKVLDT